MIGGPDWARKSACGDVRTTRGISAGSGVSSAGDWSGKGVLVTKHADSAWVKVLYRATFNPGAGNCQAHKRKYIT